MELEKRTLRGATVEGYRVLLRAEAELLLPRDYEKIGDFYLSLAEKCIAWVTEVSGERMRVAYLEKPTTTEKARFRTRTYRFRMRYLAADERHAVILCETGLDGEEEGSIFRRLSHVWYLPEQTILPHAQIRKLYAQGKLLKDVGFHPDGVYPEDGTLVFFKNATEKNDFLEKRYPIDSDGKL